jgi:Anti-sigma-D factor RsdA to sigma factor binding region
MAGDKRQFDKAPRSDRAGHAGYFAVDDPLASAASEPIDMSQVRADDALIDALADPGRDSVDPLDERLATLLLSWRHDVNTAAPGPLVDFDTAVETLRSAPRPRRRQTFGPLAAAAAVLVIAFTGVGLAARDAAPGNPLWGVTKVLYSEKAKSVEAAVAVRTKLEVASQALASGRMADAEVAIEQAQEQLQVVHVEDGQQDLVARTEQLIAQLEERTSTPPVTTEPEPPTTTGQPPTSEPALPPPSEAPTTTPPSDATSTVPSPSPATTSGETTGPGQAPPTEPTPGGSAPEGTPPDGTPPEGTRATSSSSAATES